MILRYARVSTTDQSLDGQRDVLAKAGARRLSMGEIAALFRVSAKTIRRA